MGKTRLGLAVAAQLQAIFADGVYFVPLAALTDPELVAPAILTALGIPEGRQNTKPPQLRLIEFLRRKALLLLLDNFEQILSVGHLLADLLAECPHLCILVTSRERLHLRAEQRFRVQPLELTYAVELFVQRAQASEPAFELTAETMPPLETICTKLDCLPLAIELIAAQIDLFAPQTLLTRLEQRPFEMLNDGATDLPARHRTLRNAIQSSYHLLDAQERKLFRMLYSNQNENRSFVDHMLNCLERTDALKN